jgi:hypothetical protein
VLGRDGNATDTSWRRDACVGERLLLEFITYLRMEGRAVGALQEDDMAVISGFALADERVYEVLRRAGEIIDLEGSVVEVPEPEEPDVEGDFTEEGDPMWTLRLTPPEGTWPFNVTRASLHVRVVPDLDSDEARRASFVYAGVSWNAGREGKETIKRSDWISQARTNGYEVYWEGPLCRVYQRVRLAELAEGGGTADAQARAFADWATPVLRRALALKAPPSRTRGKRSPPEGRQER